MVDAGRTDRRGDDVVNQSRSKRGEPRTGGQNREVQNRSRRTGMSKPVTSWLKKKTRTRKSLGRGRENGWDPESWLKKKTRTSKSLGRGRRKNQ